MGYQSTIFLILNTCPAPVLRCSLVWPCKRSISGALRPTERRSCDFKTRCSHVRCTGQIMHRSLEVELCQGMWQNQLQGPYLLRKPWLATPYSLYGMRCVLAPHG